MIENRYIRPLLRIISGGLLLGSGQAAARVASLILVAYLARRLSVVMFGELILAQTLTRYVNMGTDMGTKLIGTRLIAKVPEGALLVFVDLQRKRVLLGLISITLAIAYALEGPVLPFARGFLVLFSLSVFPYAVTVDWVSLGMKRFLPISIYQAGTAFLLLGTTVIFLEVFADHSLGWIALANGLALLGGAVFLWAWWRGARPKGALQTLSQELRGILRREARWSVVLLLGLAAAFNVMFQCLDVLLLGGLSTAGQVAQYGAAYKVLNVILSSFWIFTTAAYPFLANIHWSGRKRLMLAGALVGLGILGIAVAVGIHHFASPVALLLFGTKFMESGKILGVLSLAIPFDFIAAFCGAVLVSSGKNVSATLGLSIAVATNLALNLIWIPRYGAMGAARATVLSYVVLALCLIVLGLSRDAHFDAFQPTVKTA